MTAAGLHSSPYNHIMSSQSRPRVALIAAVATITRAIGCRGHLPWHIPEDLRFFKRTTMGKRIVMGRKTWDSLGRPLPGRESVVVTRQRNLRLEGAITVGSLDEAIRLPHPSDPVFVIGGGELYAAGIAIADELYLTEITDLSVPDADCFFPEVDLSKFREVWREPAVSQNSPVGPFRFFFVRYVRNDG